MPKICIDLDEWTTPGEYAKELTQSTGTDVSAQTVYNWIKRGKIFWRYIPELHLYLVKRNSQTA